MPGKTPPKTAQRTRIEQRLGARLVRQWILDGAGPARFGWGRLVPTGIRWEGKTLDEIEERLKTAETRVELIVCWHPNGHKATIEKVGKDQWVLQYLSKREQPMPKGAALFVAKTLGFTEVHEMETNYNDLPPQYSKLPPSQQ